MSAVRRIGSVMQQDINPLFETRVRSNDTVNLPLFDAAPIPETVPAPVTRDESFQQLLNEGEIGEKQTAVWRTLQKHGPLTDQLISEILRWPINCVTPRRNELMQLGFITKRDTVLDVTTNRSRARWEIVGRAMKRQSPE
jgi:hypothetical protein